jgi:hypothetical protein
MRDGPQQHRKEPTMETKSLAVWFIPLSGIDPNDDAAHEHYDWYCIEGTLTTDHAASSYGLPVIVGDDDATAYGADEILDGAWSGVPGAPRDRAMEDAAARAGYVREPNYGETTTAY